MLRRNKPGEEAAGYLLQSPHKEHPGILDDSRVLRLKQESAVDGLCPAWMTTPTLATCAKLATSPMTPSTVVIYSLICYHPVDCIGHTKPEHIDSGTASSHCSQQPQSQLNLSTPPPRQILKYTNTYIYANIVIVLYFLFVTVYAVLLFLLWHQWELVSKMVEYKGYSTLLYFMSQMYLTT